MTIELGKRTAGEMRTAAALLFGETLVQEATAGDEARGRTMNNKQETVADMIADREALRKDAERYRWLRDIGHGLLLCRWQHGQDTGPYEVSNYDDAIDAAMLNPEIDKL